MTRRLRQSMMRGTRLRCSCPRARTFATGVLEPMSWSNQCHDDWFQGTRRAKIYALPTSGTAGPTGTQAHAALLAAS